MGNSKFGRFILIGAIAGGALSMFDYATRRKVIGTSKQAVNQIGHYAKNPDVLKEKLMDQKEKYQSLFEQLSGDATYIKQQVDELRTLTPQVKDLVMNTKDAVTDSKDDIKEFVSDEGAPKKENKL